MQDSVCNGVPSYSNGVFRCTLLNSPLKKSPILRNDRALLPKKLIQAL